MHSEPQSGQRIFISSIYDYRRVIGAVSASHTILEIGEEPAVKVGDLATLVGPDHPEIHPSHLSSITGVSVYDVLMHMSSRLPKVTV